MLTFRRTNIAFGIVLVVLIGRHLQHPVAWWVYALVVVVYSLVVFYGVYFIQSQFFMKTVCRAPGAGKSIALTFDDGPSAEFTPRVLDILHAHGIKSAFFCIGKNIAGNEELLRRIAGEGHVIGNHSYSHAPMFDLFPAQKMLAELRDTDRTIEAVTGRKPRFFRPPYGVINPMVRDAVRSSGHTVLGWSLRSYDTMINDKHSLMTRLLRLLKPGVIVLLHDHGKKTIDVLPEFIQAVRERGYRIVPLDELLDNHG